MEKSESEPQSISIHALLAESDCGCCARCRYWGYFYPRSPCGERLLKNHIFFHHNLFLSTLSLRRATSNLNLILWNRNISIHALLAESDLGGMSERLMGSVFLSTLSLRRATYFDSETCPSVPNFYPRSPCGERLPPRNASCNCRNISIHALLAESDVLMRYRINAK